MTKEEYIELLADRQESLIEEHTYLRSVMGLKAFPALVHRRQQLLDELQEVSDLVDAVINTPAPGE